ncbi:SUMO-interacting motif-containing protein 1 isoform X2 [Sebastes umbrosus]|uniref:SUMO-interacting motif-containing protein 1 isoform X2 n=1 Tax=Sebastes umbrosus TaxID=72105 RepID=UPI00189E1CDA|nr:SUMO-interacting motif-containing protein 1 isoform X2 [Sebastes umbrosus]
MDDVISVSSDSEKEDSDVEIIGSFSDVMTRADDVMTRAADDVMTRAADPLPLTAVRVDVGAVNVNVPTLYIDLTDPRWTLPQLKLHKRPNSTALTVDLTETDVANGKIQKTENLPPNDSQMKEESANKNQTSNKDDCNSQQSFSRDPTMFALQQDLKPKQIHLDSQTQPQKQTDEAHHRTAVVRLTRVPFLETNVAELKTPKYSVYLNSDRDRKKMSLHLRQLIDNSEAPECISNWSRTADPHMDPSPDESPPKVVESLVRQEEQGNSHELPSTPLNVKISQPPQSPADCPCSDEGGSVATSKEHGTREDESSSSGDKAQDSSPKEVICSKLQQLELDKAESRQSSDHSCAPSPTTGPNPSEPFDLDSLSHTSPISHNLTSQVDPPPTSEPTPAEDTSDWRSEVVVKADEASNSSDILCWSVPSVPALSNEDMDDGSGTGTCRGDLGIDSPVSFLWQDGSDGDEVNKDSRFDMDFRAASREDRQYVCPVTLRKIMSGPAQALLDEEDKGFGTPEVLCRQSLSLVYSTIDESYPEGTLQLLSDLLQPGYYPPRDITSHLLRGILLDPQCPYHLCVQAFNLLMRTQRHHNADTTTVPWDWELLTSVMATQDHAKRHPWEVVRLLLDYVVQTLEDDFQAKRSISALHQSIAKATLSCDQHFPCVREVIKWLFSAIMKSTEHGESREAARERDEQIRLVSVFQRMLSLALEVDRSPALNSAKLSQELFHMLIGNIRLRAHRMLLLESLQSKLLRCKLLEHLLDYACPRKIPLPMSLSLLLHFLKYCTLAPDPSDGTERWQRWEELVHLLWMLLLSYNKAMKATGEGLKSRLWSRRLLTPELVKCLSISSLLNPKVYIRLWLISGYLCSSVSDQRSRAANFVYKQEDVVSKPAIQEAVEAFLSRSQADLGQALPLHVEESLTYLQDHLLDVCQC